MDEATANRIVTVSAWRWDDECCPVIEPSTISARQAAVEFLDNIDWTVILCPGYTDADIDPLVAAGLHVELSRIDWRDHPRYPSRAQSHLTAWVASRMRRHVWCVAHPDHHDDGVPFDACYAEPDEPVDADTWHCWAGLWALHGDPQDFIRVAAELFRDGWTPDDDDVARLEDWKQQALAVMAEWDLVFDALGRPGPLAASKASNVLAEVTRLRSERDALLWALTVSQRDVALWCEQIEHVADCLCDDPNDPESIDEACKANSTWRMALIDVDAGHGDRLVTWLPEPDQLRTFGDMIDQARSKWGEGPS